MATANITDLEVLVNQLRGLWYFLKQYNDLYSAETVPFLNSIAPDFFRDHQDLCWYYFILSISRLLDEHEKTVSIINFDKENRDALDAKSAIEASRLLGEALSEKGKFEDARGSFIAHMSAKAVAKVREMTLSIQEVESMRVKLVEYLALYDRSVKERIVDLTLGAKTLLHVLRSKR